MPKSRVARKRMYREFSRLNPRYIAKNYLKHSRRIRREFCKKHSLRESEFEFLLWGYDLEFFTIKHAAEDNHITQRHAGEELIYPLKKKEMLYKQFDKLSGSDTLEQEMYRKETKFSYRVRYALTQQARLLVQRYYNLLEESLD